MTSTDPPSQRTAALIGTGVSALGAAAATLLSAPVAVLSTLLVAVLLGAVVGNVGVLPAVARPGLALVSKRVLRLGVVLVGFRLAVDEVLALGVPGLLLAVGVVVLTFVGTRALASVLGVPRTTGLLVATGYAICGLTAVAAMRGVVDARDEEVGTAAAMVTLAGTLAIVLLPVLQGPLGLGPVLFGHWVGASVHDVGQVVAAASTAGEAALAAAVVIKLTRVVMLGPLLVAVGILERRRSRTPGTPGGWATAVPPFVLAFLAASAVRSVGLVPEAALDVLRQAETAALAMALFALGTGIRVHALRALGRRTLVLALLAWALVAGAALAAVVVVLPT